MNEPRRLLYARWSWPLPPRHGRDDAWRGRRTGGDAERVPRRRPYSRDVVVRLLLIVIVGGVGVRVLDDRQPEPVLSRTRWLIRSGFLSFRLLGCRLFGFGGRGVRLRWPSEYWRSRRGRPCGICWRRWRSRRHARRQYQNAVEHRDATRSCAARSDHVAGHSAQKDVQCLTFRHACELERDRRTSYAVTIHHSDSAQARPLGKNGAERSILRGEVDPALAELEANRLTGFGGTHRREKNGRHGRCTERHGADCKPGSWSERR